MRNLDNRAASGVVLVAGAAMFMTVLARPAGAAEKAVRSPEVTHTGKAPTGYTVTFRYANPTAKQVQIKGEWFFARPGELPQIAATPDHPVIEGQALLPADWRPGDFPLQRPNSTGPNFPVADMTKGKDGVWTYTTPLPSGIFTYAFFVDCPAPAPRQPPARSTAVQADFGSEQSAVEREAMASPWVRSRPTARCIVPSDPAFDTINYSWQGPAKVKGKLIT